MKKIIALLLLMTFCTEAGVFAATINNSGNQIMTNNKTGKQNQSMMMQNSQTMYNPNFNNINSNQYQNIPK